jgi:hypothetical protein
MYTITVELVRVRCRDTESLISSDKFALAGTIFAEDTKAPGGVSPFLYHTRINDGEERAIGTRNTVQTASPAVGVVFTALDVDNDEDLDKFNSGQLKFLGAIAGGLVALSPLAPPLAVVGGVVGLVSGALWLVIDGETTLDKDDVLAEYARVIPVAAGTVNHPAVTNHTVNFSKSDATGYSDWDYSIDMQITCEPVEEVVHHIGRIHRPAEAAETFRQRCQYASDNGSLAAVPTFYEATYGNHVVGGAVLLSQALAEWRDVPLAELGNPDLNDFDLRMRATQDYAVSHGFVGGFPNFFHADYGQGVVCGTILLGAGSAQWRDLPWSEIGNPILEDIGARFRGVYDWALSNGFGGGFPNMYHADKPTGRVSGAILLKPGVGEWIDVPIRVL